MDIEDDGWGFPVEQAGTPAPVVVSEAAAACAGAEAAPAGEAPVAKPAFVRVCWSDAVGWEICARLEQGESLMSICRDAHMPNRCTVTAWRRERPAFGEAMLSAMRAARYRRRRADLARAMRPRDNRGLWSTYTPEVGAEVCRRLIEGETLTAICRSEAMPSYSTVMHWARLVPAFGDAYAMARRLSADALFDEAGEIALSVRPGTVWADRLRFDIIRWRAGRSAPRLYVETMPELEAMKRNAIERKLAEDWQAAFEEAADAPAGGAG